LCHATHIYTEKDAAAIVSVPKEKTSRPVRVAVLSAKTGEPYTSTTSGQLWQDIVHEIITGGIFVDNLTSGIVRDLSGSPEVEVTLVRTSLISQGILSAINSSFPDTVVKKQDLVDWSVAEEPDFFPASPRSSRQSKLAIVGMSCRLPGGANDLELFWDLIKEGRDVHTRVPADRFDMDAHFDPTGETPNSTQTPFGNFIDAPGMFDANFFNMSPREVGLCNSFPCFVVEADANHGTGRAN
jgi:asperthecin polyketide synthase